MKKLVMCKSSGSQSCLETAGGILQFVLKENTTIHPTNYTGMTTLQL